MRKILLLCGLLLALSLPAMAQDMPTIDVFAGYSYVRFNQNTPGIGDIHSNVNGGSGAAAFYPSKHFGIVADFGGYKISSISGTAVQAATGSSSNAVSGTLISYLFGPRVRIGYEKVTPFAQVLFGGAHIGNITDSTGRICGTPGCTLFSSENAFALTAGGGVDVKVARHFSIRGQAEYLMTRFKDLNGVVARQNNARISAGIVIH